MACAERTDIATPTTVSVPERALLFSLKSVTQKSRKDVSTKSQIKLRSRAAKTYTMSGTITIPKDAKQKQRPLGKVIVKWLSNDGQVVRTTSTNAAGKFQFTKVADKTAVTLMFEKPGWIFSPQTVSRVIKKKNIALKVSAVPQEIFAINGTVTNVDDPTGTNKPLAGVTVRQLDQAGRLVQSTLTDATGSYLFPTARNKISYTLVFTKPGWIFTPPTQAITIQSADATMNVTATHPRYPIAGRVADIDHFPGVGGPLPGVTITQFAQAGQVIAQVLTDAAGNYVLPNSRNDTAYRIAFEKQGWILTPGSQNVVVQGAPLTLNATAVEQRFSISGTVTNVDDFFSSAGQPLPGVTVTLHQAGSVVQSVQTDATGAYFLADVRNNATYGITFEKSGWTFTPPSQNVDIQNANTTVSATAVVANYIIGGTVTATDTSLGAAGAPISGVTVQWINSGGQTVQTTTTDNSGRYSFIDVPSGESFTITFEKPGWIFTPSSSSGVVGTGDSLVSTTGVAQRFTIRGSVIDGDSHTPLTGVSIDGTDLTSGQQLGAVQTNQSGQFVFYNALGGGRRYLLNFSKNKFVEQFTFPDVPPFLVVQAGDVDAGAIAGVKSECNFHGHVGLSDLFSTSLDGVTVTLTGTGASSSVVLQALTDDDGRYEFPSVASGTYIVTAAREHYDIQLNDDSHNTLIDSTSQQKYVDFSRDCADFGPGTEYNFTANAVLDNTVYTLWIGNPDLQNVLELANPGSGTLPVTIELMDVARGSVGTQSVIVSPRSVLNIVINDFSGYASDSYGYLKLTFGNRPFDGRMVFRHNRFIDDTVYTLWLGYFGLRNVITLSNFSAQSSPVKLELYDDETGQKVSTTKGLIAARSQVAVVVNDLPGYNPQSHGHLVSTFTNRYFDARMDHYPSTTPLGNSVFTEVWSGELGVQSVLSLTNLSSSTVPLDMEIYDDSTRSSKRLELEVSNYTVSSAYAPTPGPSIPDAYKLANNGNNLEIHSFFYDPITNDGDPYTYTFQINDLQAPLQIPSYISQTLIFPPDYVLHPPSAPDWPIPVAIPSTYDWPSQPYYLAHEKGLGWSGPSELSLAANGPQVVSLNSLSCWEKTGPVSFVDDATQPCLRSNTFGHLQVKQRQAGPGVFDSRMYYTPLTPPSLLSPLYDPNQGGFLSPYDYVFADTLANPQRGKSYILFDLSSPTSVPTTVVGPPVRHLLTLINLSTPAKTFTLNEYDFDGHLVRTLQVTVPPLGISQVNGGVSQSPIGQYELVPDDSQAPYLFHSAVVSGDTDFSSVLTTFGQEGSGGVEHAHVFNVGAQFDGLTAGLSPVRDRKNFLQIANVLNDFAVDVDLIFFDNLGKRVGTSALHLAPHVQQILNVNSYLPVSNLGAPGIVRMSPSIAHSIIGQSLYYLYDHSEQANQDVMSMYGLMLRKSFSAQKTETYQLSDNENWLRLSNLGDTPVDFIVRGTFVDTDGIVQAIQPTQHLGAHAGKLLKLISTSTVGDFVEIEYAPHGAIFADILHRADVPAPFNTMDYAYPTHLR